MTVTTKKVREKRDKLINMSLRELERLSTVEKLKFFYNKEKIKIGKLIYRSDFKEFQNELDECFFNVITKNVISETQLKNLENQIEEQIRCIIKQQNIASLCEIAYGDLEQKFNLSTKSYQVALQKELKKIIEPFIKLEANETDLTYRKKIIELLDTTENIIRVTIDEIKHKCEFERVIIFIVCCDKIAGLPRRDRQKLYEKKRKFRRTKATTISNLKEFDLPYNQVEEKEYSNPEDLGWHNYETTLKHYKLILHDTLIKDCKTGKQRAKTITCILDYI